MKINTEINAPSTITEIKTHTGPALKSLIHKFHSFSPQKKAVFGQIWHYMVECCVMGLYVEALLHALISTTALLHIHSSALILPQYNHSRPLLATEQLGAKCLACLHLGSSL